MSVGTIRAAGADPTTPTVSVAPNTGLVDQQNVTLSGSNFDADATLFTVECLPAAVELTDCDPATLAVTSADDSGSFSLLRPVRRLIAPAESVVDCVAPTGCVLGVLSVTDPSTLVATAPISFDPSVPPILPTLTLHRANKLHDHQLVTVTGSGFDPQSQIDLVECAAADQSACAFETDHTVTTTNRGTFAFKTFAVERQLEAFDENGPQTVDCAAAPGTCVLSAGGGEFGGGVPSTAALQFDPSVPPVVESLAVSTSVGLTDLQPLTITGSGFLPGATVQVDQCVTRTGACDPFPVVVTAGFGGSFAVTYGVRRVLPVLGFTGLRKTDCASRVEACTIFAGDGGEVFPALAPLDFDRLTPATASTLTALPNTNLQDNDRVDVSLAGFAPYQPITILECTARALGSQDTSYCDPNTQVVTTTPAGGGAPTVSFFVRRAVAVTNGLVNCGARAGACILIATTDDSFSNGSLIASEGSGFSDALNASTSGAQPHARSSFTRPALQAAARASVPGVASATLTFGPLPSG